MYPPDGVTPHDPRPSSSSDDGSFLLVPLTIAASLYLGYDALTIARRALAFEIGGVPIYLGLGVVALLLLAGALIDLYREIRLWRSVAAAQLMIAVAAGLYGFASTIDLVARLVTLAAAAMTVANAFGKLREIGRKRREQAAA